RWALLQARSGQAFRTARVSERTRAARVSKRTTRYSHATRSRITQSPTAWERLGWSRVERRKRATGPRRVVRLLTRAARVRLLTRAVLRRLACVLARSATPPLPCPRAG